MLEWISDAIHRPVTAVAILGAAAAGCWAVIGVQTLTRWIRRKRSA